MFGVDVMTDDQAIFVTLVHQSLDALDALCVGRHVQVRRQHVVAGLDTEQVKLDVTAQLGELSQTLGILDAACESQDECRIKMLKT